MTCIHNYDCYCNIMLKYLSSNSLPSNETISYGYFTVLEISRSEIFTRSHNCLRMIPYSVDSASCMKCHGGHDLFGGPILLDQLNKAYKWNLSNYQPVFVWNLMQQILHILHSVLGLSGI